MKKSQGGEVWARQKAKIWTHPPYGISHSTTQGRVDFKEGGHTIYYPNQDIFESEQEYY